MNALNIASVRTEQEKANYDNSNKGLINYILTLKSSRLSSMFQIMLRALIFLMKGHIGIPYQ